MEPNVEDIPILLGQTGPLSGQRWLVNKAIVVGREATCDIVIPDRQVSRRHARLTPSTNGIILEDLGSKNGTHFNGKRAQKPVILQDGDVVQIALAQEFVFISGDATMPLTQDNASQLHPPRKMLNLEKRSRQVWLGEDEVVPPLSVAQFTLLEMLYEADGRVVSRKALATEIWGDEEALDVSNQALDALIRRLRDRLAAVDPTHNYIVTVRGHGLRLENPEV